MKLRKKLGLGSFVLSILVSIVRFLGYLNFQYLPEILWAITESIFIFETALIVFEIRSELKENPEATFIDRWMSAVTRTFGDKKVFHFVANEFLVFFYFFYGMLHKPKTYSNEFSYTNAGTLKYFILTVILVSFAEIPTFHILFGLWNETVAWVVTFLSVYSLMWILGDFQLMRFHPIRVEQSRIRIRIGFRWKLDLDYTLIQSIELGSPKNKKEYMKLTPESKIGIMIHLKETVTVIGLFGIRKDTDKIALQVDDNEWLAVQIRSKLAELWQENTGYLYNFNYSP